ncbi:MAG TPA: sugar ABC transporter permease [Anaerolineae bacterium]|mgnify:FL=1|nr:sugar ABC transporter permease [Anaerolineae bacterium]HOQ98605.1 sugar ABC transporter permease [Anaerolineae bacterium]HPL28766.1 sugar ABC transporter permease [Anaerolineae bacterium]
MSKMHAAAPISPHRGPRDDSLGARLTSFVDHHANVLYPAPAIIALLALFVVPIAFTVYLSFQSWSLSATYLPKFVGLQNYVNLVTESRFHQALLNTFYYTILVLIIQLPLGIVMALIFNRPFWGRGVARTLFLFPMMATPVASLIGWRLILDPSTGVFRLLAPLGVPPITLLATDKLLIPTFVAIDTWQWTPFVALLMLAGLSGLPVEPFEAATIDGASSWQIFWQITLPLLRPVVIVAALFRIIDTLKVFDTIFVLTTGGVGSAGETLNIYAYRESFEYFHMGYAASLLVVFFLIILLFSLVLMRIRRGE